MFEWSDELKTGNQVVDQQHKELIQAFYELMKACEEGRGREEIGGCVEFLEQYTRQHFGDEEKLQLYCGYAGYGKHKKQHENFCRRVAELRDRLEKEGPTEDLMGSVIVSMGNWLVTHIKGSDKAMAEYIREHALESTKTED